MSDYDTADGCIISKARDDNEASSQAATQPCEDLSESLCNSFAEQDRSCEEDRVRYNSVGRTSGVGGELSFLLTILILLS